MSIDIEPLGYLTPDPLSLWEWRDEGQALCWRHGTTIAFRAEVAAVVARLAPDGLPPLDAIALVMAATRRIWQGSAVELGALGVLPVGPGAKALDPRLADLAELLDSVARLPAELRQTPAQKAALAAMVFEGCRRSIAPPAAQKVVAALEAGLPPRVWRDRPTTQTRPSLLERLFPFRALGRRVTPEGLRLWTQTGLESLPLPAPADSPVESLRSLLARLESDDDLGGLARLARNLMAALSLPRAVSEPQDLPLGGVSDISNRGSFDRLLLSELAQDDLTFTVRVALNEALYLRREAPPRVPPQSRLIVIDCGLRLWGVPRVYATAAALALAAVGDQPARARVFRARGEHLDCVELGTPSGLAEHLAILQPEAHPAAALPVLQRLASEAEPPAEVVLITADDVLADPALQRGLAKLEIPCVYLVSVSRGGRLKLSARSPRGTRLLREVRCDLDQILAPRVRAAPLLDSRLNPDLPALVQQAPFPLRLPHAVDPARLWGEGENGLLCLTGDGRLMLWDHPARGARQLSAAMPGGTLHWFDPAARLLESAVIGRLSQNGLRLVQLDLSQTACVSTGLALRSHDPLGVSGHAGVLLVIFSRHVELYSSHDGQFLQSIPLRHRMRWLRQRFFADEQGWWALSFDGTAATFKLLCTDRSWRQAGLIALADLQGFDGPAGINWFGEVRRLEPHGNGSERWVTAATHLLTPSLRPPVAQGSYTLGAISASGRRLVLVPRAARREAAWLIDLDLALPLESQGNPQALLAAKWVKQAVQNRTLRHRFDSIGVRGTSLALISARGMCFELGCDWANHRLYLRLGTSEMDVPYSLKGHRPFQPTPAPAGAGYNLSVAIWDDGSRAFLDSRGLLHLKCSDASIPELSLVLHEGTMAGWCSDGRLFGPDYFIGDAPGSPPEELFVEALDPFVERIR